MTDKTHLLYTIGYTKKSAEQFFELLRKHNVETLIDVRANNTSQLAAFTKRQDLPYFLDKLLGIRYLHWDFLAPTPEIRATLKDPNEGWPEYERRFIRLMRDQDILDQIDRDIVLNQACCLLCSEPTADHCHRRLVAEHLAHHLPAIQIKHL